MRRREFVKAVGGAALAATAAATAEAQQTARERFEGRYFAGEGDVEYLRLLETAARMYHPDPELQNISMLYSPAWNGFVEGPTWGAWWIQNSYGPSYCALPFLTEPYTTFLQNSQDLWFSQMGDGQRQGVHDWVAPDGCLCDAAAPNWIVYKQGDGRIDIHDWGMEFTAAGIVLQAELLLISRDREAIARYLPKLERCANFVESRCDPKTNLFLAGPAGNLLAPSYAGWLKPDGTYGQAYVTGLSVTYIAALDRLIELEKLAGRTEQAALYGERRRLARQGLPALTTDEGYFIKYLDPDGTRHGVYGAQKHGYFEAVCNHDAIAFRVADDAQAEAIYRRIASIPGLRPHDVVITNCPSLDDMYVPPTGLWEFGRWVNGGHWTTCEARMVLAYYRLGKHDDARRSMEHILTFARAFRMDNNLVDFGAHVYQPNEPINCVYDTWGAPSALIRGLFEYLYTAEGVTLLPHLPPGITRLEQRLPIRLGDKRIYLAAAGAGEVTSVWVNGKPWTAHDRASVRLPYGEMPVEAQVTICLGPAKRPETASVRVTPESVPPPGDAFWDLSAYAALTAGNQRPLRLGANSGGGNQFLGAMGRGRIWGRALSADEVAALAAGQTRTLPADPALIADWVLSQTRDGLCPNAAGGDLSAKEVGKVEVTEAGVRLSGEGYLEVAFDPRLEPRDAYTLDAWICPAAQPGMGSRIIDKVTAGVDDGYLLDTCPGNSLRLITEQGHAGFDARLEPGEWVHVAGTFDPAGDLRLYVGGKLVASTPAQKRAGPQWARWGAFCERLRQAGLEDSYEAQHARLIVEYVKAIHERERLIAEGKLPPLPPVSQHAADRSYTEAATRLAQGLETVLASYEGSEDGRKQAVAAMWGECSSASG
jgi:hypothetical protein